MNATAVSVNNALFYYKKHLNILNYLSLHIRKGMYLKYLFISILSFKN
jgi:hypothetical protein